MEQERLKRLLDYDPKTGEFVWREAYCFKVVPGKRAGGPSVNGYWVIGIDGVRHYAHRLAFLYMTGQCPPLVDHIDQNKANNAWGNLRAASKAVNALNSKTSRSNKSGSRGVSWHRAGRKWRVHCGSVYLGLFETKEAASAAYEIAAKEKLCLAT